MMLVLEFLCHFTSKLQHPVNTPTQPQLELLIDADVYHDADADLIRSDADDYDADPNADAYAGAPLPLLHFKAPPPCKHLKSTDSIANDVLK